MPLADAAALIVEAARSRYALPALNVANTETVQGVLRAAEACGSPVILQISPGAIAYAGYETIRSLAFEEARRSAIPAVVHLDHCRDPDTVRQAIADGFLSVMFDGSRLAYEHNVELTRAVVDDAHAVGVAVEAELGYIGGSEDTTIEQARAAATTPEQAAEFVAATEVDVLAPAIGSVHRMPEESVELDVESIRRVAVACRRPLALHGGSGVKRAQLPALIDAGVAKVNISSQVGRALALGIRQTWADDPAELDLRRYLAAGRAEIERLAAGYMQLCGSAGRADGASIRRGDVLAEPE
jgi:ketose-bisphosphate aldolase